MKLSTSRWPNLLLCLLIFFFAHNVLATNTVDSYYNPTGIVREPADTVVIDAKHLKPDELDIKRALLHTRLHYGWELKEHTRNSLLIERKNVQIKVSIADSVVKLIPVNSDEVEVPSKWLPRFKKLYLRQLTYLSDVRQAQAMIQ